MDFAQNNKKKKVSAKPQGVMEALSEIGGQDPSVPKTEFVAPSALSALDQLAQKAPALNFNQNGQKESSAEKKDRQFAQLFFENKKAESRLVYSQREEEVTREILSIQDELRKIAASLGDIDRTTQELKAAAFEPIPAPGVYHLNFLQKVKQLLILARKKIQESTTWLEIFNQRRQKRNFYWCMVNKKGTSFMLSAERYTATQAG